MTTELVLDESEIDHLPEVWRVVQLGELIIHGPQNGLYKHASFYGEGIPILCIDALALRACDAAIAGLEREAALHEELFRALLEELMTGRVRVGA